MSDTTKDGGPAFARPGVKDGYGNVVGGQSGMTLRDYFAAQALSAMIAKSPFFDTEGENGKAMPDMMVFKAEMAESAYWYADAMLAERSK